MTKLTKLPMALFFIFIFVLAAPGLAQTGDPEAGRAFWASAPTGVGYFCAYCHGKDGNGGFGPDLSGRKLTLEQFTRAIRQPFGIMPAYIPQQVSDRDIANLHAYFSSRPPVAAPDPPRAGPITGTSRVAMVVQAYGCLQCHSSNMAFPRAQAGAVGGDFSWFAGMVYDHTNAMPAHYAATGEGSGPVRMGTFSRQRLPEWVLRGAWDEMVAMGLRPKLEARFAVPVKGERGIAYTVSVANMGVAGKGLAAEDASIEIALPSGLTVASANGGQVSRDAKTAVQTVTWKGLRINPQDKQTYTVVVSGDAKENPKGVVRWEKPVEKDADGREVAGQVDVAPPPRS